MQKTFLLSNRVVEIVRTARALRREVGRGTFAPSKTLEAIGRIAASPGALIVSLSLFLFFFLSTSPFFDASANGGESPSATRSSQEPNASKDSTGAPPSAAASPTSLPEPRLSPKVLELLRRDANGTQTRYPGVAKVVGRGKLETKESGEKAIPLYYGTGSLVAVYDDLGLVLTNWHVVSESDASIEAIFPNFSTEALVVLRDEVWDLAALVVRRPPGVAPIPISLQVPRPGETLWIAGYGQKAGLDNFQIRSGRLISYVDLVSPNSLPTETLAIDAGARQGDSGGPIFNRFGEIAGVLWGSDGKATMGTYCLRVQIFLTQAVARVAALRAKNWDESRPFETTNDLARWNRKGLLGKGEAAVAESTSGSSASDESGETSSERVETVVPAANESKNADKRGTGAKTVRGRRALRSALESGVAVEEDDRVSAIDALPAYGVFPISPEPAYSAPVGGPSAEDLLSATPERAREAVESAANALERNGGAVLPPSPPIFSPTFVVQQRQTGRARPETADVSFWTKLDESAIRLERGEVALARAGASTVVGVPKPIVETSVETSEASAERSSAERSEAGKSGTEPASVGEPALGASFETTSLAKDAADSADEVGKLSSVAGAASRAISGVVESAADEPSEDGKSEKDAASEDGAKGDEDDLLRVWQKYVLVCAVFALFYNSARLLAAAERRAEIRRAAKRRRKDRL